jgi:hypothetical protein
MVDEAAFRQVLCNANLQSCPFSKAVLAGCFTCALIEKHYIAERESLVCADSSARLICTSLHQLLYENSTFALKHIHGDDPLTHSQELKLQCGGLNGLQYVVNGAESVEDIFNLIDAAFRKFGALEVFPYSQIIQSIASFKMRKRHQAKRPE